jgi:hypothetical protein
MTKELLSRRVARARAGGISKSTEQRLEATDPTWLHRVWITPGRSGYYADEIDQWCAARERVRRTAIVLDMMTAASGKTADIGQHRETKGSPPAAAQQARLSDACLELSAERRS